MDSTFFDKSFENFPTQFESNKIICDLIDEWIRKGPEYVVIIRASARYGSECLFGDIYKRTGVKIHVYGNELERYRYFPELDDCFTTNLHSQIHGCYSYYDRNCTSLSCQPNKDEKYIRVIKPTAFVWQNWKLTEPIHEYDSVKKWWRVCYSNHSSYNEIRDFILYLKPKEIKLNVEPESAEKLCEYRKSVQDIMKSYANRNDDDENLGSTSNESSVDRFCEPITFKNIQVKRSVKKKSINLRKIAMEDNDDIVPERNILRKRRKN